MKNKYLIITACFILVIWSVIVYLFLSKVNDMTGSDPSGYYLKDEYSGKVIDKFIDKEQHNYKTLIIKQVKTEHKVIFSFVKDGLYDYIEKGDTLSKKSGTLDLRLKRKNLDTVITMLIYDRRKSKKNN